MLRESGYTRKVNYNMSLHDNSQNTENITDWNENFLFPVQKNEPWDGYDGGFVKTVLNMRHYFVFCCKVNCMVSSKDACLSLLFADTTVVIIVSVSLALLVCALIPLVFYGHWRSNAGEVTHAHSNACTYMCTHTTYSPKCDLQPKQQKPKIWMNHVVCLFQNVRVDLKKTWVRWVTILWFTRFNSD